MTTEDVIDWLDEKKAVWVRVNGIDINLSEYKISEKNAGGTFNILPNLFFETVKAVWFRRWYTHPNPVDWEDVHTPDTLLEVKNYVAGEVNVLTSLLYNQLEGIPWLSGKHQAKNKIINLKKAQLAGLDIPPTLITSSKHELKIFLEEYKSVISKAISSTTSFQVDEALYMMYSEVLTEKVFNDLPDNFLPSLFQQQIEKEFEIRVFVLGKELYPMAIFSQADSQTKVDFRRYNHKRPNRTVPFKLPDSIEKAILKFMKSVNLNTGSIDLIRTPDKRYIFLEVNPDGQFGMVSYPCNYRLEKKVAEYLIEMSNE